jgi:DNA-binding GntR family transcriptional regulator
MVAAHAENDVEAFMEANYRFRAAWLEIVPNRRLLRAIELYADHVRYLRALTLGNREVRAVVLNGLKRIAASLSAADGAGASAAMREHLLEAKRILRNALTPNSK